MQSSDENFKKKKIAILNNKNKSIDFQNKNNLIKIMNFYHMMFNAIFNRLKNVKIVEVLK